MTEIEQLRAEIKILNQAAEIASKLDGCGCEMVVNRRARKMKEELLAKLEAEANAKADPWREHKEVLSGRFHTQQGADHDEKLVLNYAMHLQQTNEKLAFKARLDAARIAELEADNARLERSVARYKTAGDHTADLMRYMLDRKEVISKPAGYEAINEMQRLDARIAELEAGLSRRPVVWQLRDRKSGKVRLVGEFGRKYAAIYSDAEIEYLKTLDGWVAFTNDYAIEPYTGEQK